MALDTTGYERARRATNVRAGHQLAANEYGRFTAQQRGSRQVADLARGHERAWPKMSAGWGARGHTGGNVKSGFYEQAMQDYVGDHQRNRNTLLDGLQQEQHQFGLTATSIEAERERALAEIEQQKQQQIALLAQAIQSIRPSIYGG